jgi:hypothetical protein
MGAAQFLTKALEKGENRNEASRSRPHLKRMIAQLGVKLLIEAMREA